MDEALTHEVEQWCHNMANCISTQPDWDTVYAQVLHTLTVFVNLEMCKNSNMNTTQGAAEWVVIQDRIKSKIETLMEAYK